MTLWNIASSTSQTNPKPETSMQPSASTSASAPNFGQIPPTASNFFYTASPSPAPAPNPGAGSTASMYHVPFPTFSVPASGSTNNNNNIYHSPSHPQPFSGSSSSNPKVFAPRFSPNDSTVDHPEEVKFKSFSSHTPQQQSQASFTARNPVEVGLDKAPSNTNGSFGLAVNPNWSGSSASAPSAPPSNSTEESHGGWNHVIPTMAQPPSSQQPRTHHSTSSSTYSFSQNMRESEQEYKSQGTNNLKSSSNNWTKSQQQPAQSWMHPEQQQQPKSAPSSAWNHQQQQHPEQVQSLWAQEQSGSFSLPNDTLVFHGSHGSNSSSGSANLGQQSEPSWSTASGSSSTTKVSSKFPSTAWLWYNDKVTFVPYDIETSELLEKSFQQQQKSVEIQIRSQKYIVDFGEMCQVDKDTRSKKRLVIRADMSSWTGAQSKAEPSKPSTAGNWLASVVSNLVNNLSGRGNAGSSNSTSQAEWKWFGDQGRFESYDKAVSEKIEEGYQMYLSSGKKRAVATIMIQGRPYKINYDENTQLSTQGKVRKIKRKSN